MSALVGLVLLFALLALGMPVAFALLASGAIGLMLIDVNAMTTVLTTTPFRTVANFTITTIPLFIFMAEVLSKAGFAKDLFRVCYVWIGHWRGGLAIATTMACALMGAMSGSTSATAAAMSRITIPEMDSYKYERMLSTAVVAFGGTIAIMIPPSIPLIIYGVLTETSIGKLLIAGILPGLLITAVVSMGIYILVKRKPELAPPIAAFSWSERFQSLKGIWSVLLIIFVVIGSIYSGFATATEAAAIGASAAVLIGIFTKRVKNVALFIEATKDTIKTTAMIFSIIIGAMVFGHYLTYTGASNLVVNSISALPLPPIGILLVIILLYLILGCFMDGLAILLLVTPLTFPIISNLGFDPIWFGILVILSGEIGLITPPLGLNVYIVGAISGEPLENIFKGIVPILFMVLLALALLIVFPDISTWLPSTLKGNV